LDLARAGGGKLWLEVIPTDGRPDALGQLQHARLHPGADVDRAPLVALLHREQGIDHVPHVDVVARLLTRAEYGRLTAVARKSAEDRHHPGLGRRVLPGPVDVSETHGARRHLAGARVEVEVTLGGQLALAIDRERLAGGALGEGQLVGAVAPLSVYGTSG